MDLYPQFISAKQAAEVITDGCTLFTVGMTLSGASESVLKEIENSFINTNRPQNITFFHASGQSDKQRGMEHLAHEGLIKRIVGSHWGLAPKLMDLITNDKVEVYCFPQGQITHLLRDMASGQKGHLSKIGIGTFVDPRQEGGKMNSRTKQLADMIELVNLFGEEYLYYHEVPIDVTLVRGTTADEHGNVTFEDEAMKLEVLPAVLAAKHYGGKVIVQVKRVAAAGTLNPKEVIIPGVFVDYVVVSENPEEDHRQTSSWFYDPAYSGTLREPDWNMSQVSMDIRKLIGRRAVLELRPGAIFNLGTGIPNDVIGGIINEEKVGDQVMATVESGVYGGIPAGGIDFGIAKNMEALIEHPYQFDFYNGTGVDFTFMGVGQVDAVGNVNSTKFEDRSTGSGGFIDITQCAKNVVFCTTFTARGLQIEVGESKIRIIHEGSIKKFVRQVEQISFNGQLGLQKGQRIVIVTERAVFELNKNGMELIEIAPGINLERDILGQMEFYPTISPQLKLMTKSIFEKVMGLKEKWRSEEVYQ